MISKPPSNVSMFYLSHSVDNDLDKNASLEVKNEKNTNLAQR